MQTDISTNKGRIIALEADGVILENQIAEINKTIEPYKNYRDLILGETARAVEVETKLRSDLDSEVIRAQEVEDSLIELTNQHTVSIDSLEQTTKTNSESISKEREDRLAQESVFSSQLQGVAQKVSRNEESIIQVNNSILQVQNDRSFVKNDFNPEVENQVFVAKIIFVNSEEDLPAIREAGTLYLVREEEE